MASEVRGEQDPNRLRYALAQAWLLARDGNVMNPAGLEISKDTTAQTSNHVPVPDSTLRSQSCEQN